MSVERKPSDVDLASQPTMTRLENSVGMKTLYKIGKLFVDDYMASFDKPRSKACRKCRVFIKKGTIGA